MAELFISLSDFPNCLHWQSFYTLRTCIISCRPVQSWNIRNIFSSTRTYGNCNPYFGTGPFSDFRPLLSCWIWVGPHSHSRCICNSNYNPALPNSIHSTFSGTWTVCSCSLCQWQLGSVELHHSSEFAWLSEYGLPASWAMTIGHVYIIYLYSRTHFNFNVSYIAWSDFCLWTFFWILFYTAQIWTIYLLPSTYADIGIHGFIKNQEKFNCSFLSLSLSFNRVVNLDGLGF